MAGNQDRTPGNTSTAETSEAAHEVDVEKAQRVGREVLDAADVDVAGLLDEIDDVLEENAEQFTRGFVQRSGQ